MRRKNMLFKSTLLVLSVLIACCYSQKELALIPGSYLQNFNLTPPARPRASKPKSNVPTFVHDLDHPWAKKKRNIAWLDRLPDRVHALCNEVDDARKADPGGSIPLDLFDRLDVSNDRDGEQQYDWEKLKFFVEDISKCPAALQRVKYLHLDLLFDDDAQPSPGEEVGDLMAEVISSMPNLQRVHWGLPSFSAPFFEQLFARKRIKLPMVKYLTLSAESHFLIRHCPNISHVGNDVSYKIEAWSWWHVHRDRMPVQRFLQAVSSAPTVTSLAFWNANEGWSLGLIQDVIAAAPNLEHLSLLGYVKDIGFDYWLGDGEGNLYDEDSVPSLNELVKFEQLLRSVHPSLSPSPSQRPIKYLKGQNAAFQAIVLGLRKAQSIKTLRLPDEADNGGYFGCVYPGDEIMRRHTESHIRSIQEASSMAWEMLPHLEEISIGNFTPTRVEKDAAGKVVRIEWEWTGRVGKWVAGELGITEEVGIAEEVVRMSGRPNWEEVVIDGFCWVLGILGVRWAGARQWCLGREYIRKMNDVFT